jgi:hypothetical protein
LEQALLNRVLRPRRGVQEAPTVGQQRLAVALHQHLEGKLVAFARELQQALVSLDLQQWD